jgi:hypothetical protein
LVSGPGSADFTEPASPATSVTFSAAGSYVLRLSASSALGETSRTLSVTVAPPPLSPLESWRVTHFDSAINSGIGADLADPDADTFPNFLEFALGTLPLSPDSASQVRLTASNPALTLTFFRARPSTEVTYEVQASTDLLNWSTIATNPGSVGSEVSVTTPATLPASGSRFLHLRVTSP